ANADSVYRDGAPDAGGNAGRQRLVHAKIRFGHAVDLRLDGQQMGPRSEIAVREPQPDLAGLRRRSRVAGDREPSPARNAALHEETAGRGDRPRHVGDARPDRRHLEPAAVNRAVIPYARRAGKLDLAHLELVVTVEKILEREGQL